MRKQFVVFMGVGIGLLVGCSQQVGITAERAQVEQVINHFVQMFETEDMELLSDIFAHDPEIVGFGTDANEHLVGFEAIRKSMQAQFAAFEGTNTTSSNQAITVHPSGQVAWFSQVLDLSLTASGEPVQMEGVRFTGVLKKQNDRWVFVQFHASVPVAGQAAEY